METLKSGEIPCDTLTVYFTRIQREDQDPDIIWMIPAVVHPIRGGKLFVNGQETKRWVAEHVDKKQRRIVEELNMPGLNTHVRIWVVEGRSKRIRDPQIGDVLEILGRPMGRVEQIIEVKKPEWLSNSLR